MRGVSVNGAAVVAARLKSGWTQDDLAQRADVDAKTVRKAEQGKRLDVAPLSRLAAALGVELKSLIDTPVSGAELQLSRKEVVLEWTRAWDAADMDAILALYTESAVLRIPGGPSIPFGGVYRGREQIRQANEINWSTVRQEPLPVEEMEFFLSENAVILKGDKGAYMPNGELVRFPCVQVFTFEGLLIADHHVDFDTLDFATKYPFPTP